MKLPFVRFVRQVSSRNSLSRYGYIGIMANNAYALKEIDWKEATCPPSEVALPSDSITKTDGIIDSTTGEWTKKPTYTAWIDDRYDVYNKCGDYVPRNATICGYSGCVAYRFKLPDSNPSAMTRLKLVVRRDRALRSGVKVAISFSNIAIPSNEWGSIHPDSADLSSSSSSDSGSDSSYDAGVSYVTQSVPAEENVIGVRSWGFLGQPETPNLMSAQSGSDTIELTPETFSAMSDAGDYSYLYVYITLEDGYAYWDMYSSSEQRYYYIEGSAVLDHAMCEYSFEDPYTGFSGGGSKVSAIDNFATMRDYLIFIPGIFSKNRRIAPELFRMNKMAGFITAIGKIKSMIGAGSLFNRYVDSLPRKFMHGMNQLNGSEESIDGKEWGDPKSYVRASSMDMYANWPRWFNNMPETYPYLNRDGILFMVRNSFEQINDKPKHVLKSFSEDGAACGQLGMMGYSQVVFGYVTVAVPAERKSYSRIHIKRESGAGCISKNVGLSLNIWQSKSVSCLGQYANAAFSAISQHPELFTGSKSYLSGKAAFNVYDYYSDAIAESIEVEADASLIANVSADPLTSGDENEIVIRNKSLLPGDVLIIAPKVDSLGNENLGAASLLFNGDAIFGTALPEYFSPTNQSGLPITVSFD